MTSDEIEQMKADMEAGTPGCFSVIPSSETVNRAVKIEGKDVVAADMRRRQRLPQLEAEVLRLRDALIHINSMDPEHYRIDSFSGESLRGIVLEMGMQARVTLNGGTDD